MATLESAEALLEELRAASYDAAKADLKDVHDYAASKVWEEFAYGKNLLQLVEIPGYSRMCTACLPPVGAHSHTPTPIYTHTGLH